ncbi:leucine-rich repeat and IQ domain-containing protein 3 [Camelus dromedarius]|uniref:Leucine-rich repeat and IQ domain-containing protein 3 n=2 Tax=Camelus TaxID=9836 RepID=A0A8B6YA52_CAMFR|nr:leucine-rich repeat and IQ domain-containing protein 3 [Camelus ferus]XP_010961760.1 leucine-rich repeat and IQ domain-containing protein 3 isoform X1 [Camelus bactrianus]XP_010987381.1 leucine-rich repeat and IQ domain-containing protein 3 [Camelus dromedarius]
MFHGTITEELTSHREWSHYNENIIEDQKDFVFVKFSGLHLKSMENMQSCISLRVCIFSNNFITDIRPLQSCIKLVKLDLHGNQIKSLPDTKFWSGLKNLKLLYLHDNGFAKLKNVCMLSACPSLIALTLFDCPVSLKKGYRHVLVNSIWPLKALDHHVISDEEIIQNWHLPERFKTCNYRLFFNFCPALKKGSAYEDEINNIKHIISKINEILAHNSPVLIVQRWIRGFLVRKKMSPLFLRKKHQKKINECEAKWIYIHRRYEDKLFKDLFFLPGTNKTEKLPRWKYNIYSPVDLQISSEQRKHVSSISYELKTKRPRHLIQKGQKETEDEIEDEESDVSFRISAFKLPIHTADSLKYAAVLNEKQRDYFPAYAQPFPTTHQKPVIRKKDMLLERSVRREFFTTQRAGMKFHALHDSEKYCSEQKKQESHKNKVTAVSMAQVAQERVRLAVQENLNNKIHATQKLSAKDNETIQDGLRRLWQDRSNYLEKVKERRALFLEEKKQRAKDRLLIQNLSNERTLLIKGITKIERLGKKKDVLKEKRLIVQQKLKTEKYQKDLRKQMKEIRAQEIHKRHCEEKFVNDMIAFQKACERFQDAKTRAATVKTNLGFKVPSGMTQ